MSETRRIRAASYLRQSTSREESISLELQETTNAAYCDRRGYDVLAVLSDPGVSGLQLERRPGMQEALRRVEAREVDVVVVYRWSRLSRRRIHQAVIIDRIETAGGRAESSTEPVDATTAGGRLSRGVFMEFAAFESDVKSEQWREAQARRRKLGLTHGGAPPFGYAKPPHRGEPFKVDPVTGPAVAELYARYLRGHGLQRLARWLGDEGHVTTRDGEWNVRGVQRLLDSGFAAGLLRVNVRGGHPRHVPGAHEAVIDAATWAAYERERGRRRRAQPRGRGSHWHLGGGLTVCALCDANLIVNTYEGKSQAICSRYKASRRCDGVWVNRHRLETVVALWLGGHVREWANAQDDVRAVNDERARLAKDLDATRADDDHLAERQRAIARRYGDGELDDSEFDAARRANEARRRELAERIADLEARLDALAPDADVYERLTRGSEGMTDDEWRAVLRRVIRRVDVGPETIVITPRAGEPRTYDRKVVTPKRPARERETPHGTAGRFVTKDR